MRNFSINFCNETNQAIASIDGYETYRVSESDQIGNWIVEVKSEVDESWGLPEDNDGSGQHDEFDSAVCEILERLQNDSTDVLPEHMLANPPGQL